MGGRPGTPSRERLELAQSIIIEAMQRRAEDPEYTPDWEKPGELNPAHRDVRMLLDYKKIGFLSREAHDEVQDLATAEQIQDMEDIIPFAIRESDEKFIGMIIDLGSSGAGSSESGSSESGSSGTENHEADFQEYRIVITYLYRDPEWVGFNEQLHWCRGLEIHVFSNRNTPEEPNMIIATTPGSMNQPGQPGPQNPISRAMEAATRWHGAVSYTWHIREENKPQKEE